MPGWHLLARCLTPGDPLHESGKEYILVASSLAQARIVSQFVREELAGAAKEYSWLDSTTRVAITHRETNTRLKVLSSKAKSAFGIVGCPLLIFDEPGALETVGGTLLSDAVFSSQGKPNSTLRVILIGTIAPSTAGWWADLVAAGTNGSVYVMALQGDPERWGFLAGDSEVQSAHGNLAHVQEEAASGAGRGAKRYPVEGQVFVIPLERPDRRRINHASND